MTSSDPALGKPDVDRPSSARIYDYFLGGAHNFEVDRKAAEDLAGVHPGIGLAMQANRSFLRRAVRYLSDHGIDQFLDLGSGIPTVGNVHEIAQRGNPNARVVYVDIESIAVTHSKTILAGNKNAAVIEADLRDSARVLDHPETTRLLDLSRPVALIMAGVLQYVDDEHDPAGLIAGYRDRLASGSYLALSHPSMDNLAQEREAGAREASSIYDRTATPFTYRTKARFETFFDGVDLVEPGVVLLWEWRPESAQDAAGTDGQAVGLAGVGRKP